MYLCDVVCVCMCVCVFIIILIIMYICKCEEAMTMVAGQTLIDSKRKKKREGLIERAIINRVNTCKRS